MTMITIGTAIGAGGARGETAGGTPSGPTGTVSIAAFVGERPIFDTGAALGLTEAQVPLSGTGTPGAQIELRVVTEAGVPVTAWEPAQVGAGGTWSAVLDAPLSQDWLAPQARLAGAAGPQAQGGLFGAGHVIAIWQQSEHHHLILGPHDGTAPPILRASDEGNVHMTWARGPAGLDTAVRAAFIDNASAATPEVTAGMVAMADTLARARPGDKFEVIWQVKGGTSWNALLDDDEDPFKRDWAVDLAVHDAATADGQEVGLAWSSWYASPSFRSTNYVSSLLPAWFGVDASGAPASIDGHEHDFTEIYDYARTRWLLSDPHRFEGGPGDRATIQACREAVRADHALPGAAGRIVPPNIALLSYLNGEDDGVGGWRDWTHPGADDVRGIQRLARLTAGSALMGMGLLPLDVPVFDSAEWQPDGSYMELWDSAGALTTERLAEGMAAIDDAGAPHRTEVMGITVDGLPATRAEIVEGRVRVWPAPGTSFDATSYVRYGEGGATGGSADVEGDLRAGINLNLPVRDAGVPGAPFVAVRPLPPIEVLANTIAGGGAQFTRGPDGAAFLQDQASFGARTLGAGRSAFTFDMVLVVPDDDAAKVSSAKVLEITGLQARVALDLRPTKGGGTISVANAERIELGAASIPYGTIAYGAPVRITVAGAFATAGSDGFFRVEVDGAVLADQVVPAGTVTGAFGSTRSVRFLNLGAAPMGFGPFRLWWQADPTGGVPSAAPDVEIGPELTDVNAHPWKVGPDAS